MGTQVEALGAGEIVLTSMDCDGTCDGYDLEITGGGERRGFDSGGGQRRRGQPEHLADAILTGHADAVLAASIFHFGQYYNSGNQETSWPARHSGR